MGLGGWWDRVDLVVQHREQEAEKWGKWMSAQPCGCDLEAGWICTAHRYPAETGFVIKDSGKRLEFASGSLRDTTEGKINYAKVAAGPMLKRWAQHLTNGAKKYPDVAPGVGNWTLIETDEEYWRYKESAFRHFMQWFNDEVDEDHASAVYFNINGVELIKEKRSKKS